MGTSDFSDHEELDFRDLKKVRRMEMVRVRRELFWWRCRTWVLIAAIIALPAALMAWMVWVMR